MKQNKIRIKDIAELAGVSEGTVDRVLHKRGKVSSQSFEKVTKVLEEIKYTPNIIARTLGTNRSYSVIIITPLPHLDPYWQLSYEGTKVAESELAQFGLTLSMEYNFFDPFIKETFLDATIQAFNKKPDGIIISPQFQYSSITFLNKLSDSNIPFIITNSNIENINKLSFVGQDYYQSGKLAGELLSFSGTTSGVYYVLHLNEDLNNSSHLTDKEHGFRDYFSSLKNRSNKQFVVESLNINTFNNSFYREFILGICNHPELSGIYVSTSKAYLIARELEIRNHSIPLVGYDLIQENIELLKKGYIQFLIHQNPTRQAKVAVRALANYIFLDKKPPQKILFPLEIISPSNIDSYLQNQLNALPK